MPPKKAKAKAKGKAAASAASGQGQLPSTISDTNADYWTSIQALVEKMKNHPILADLVTDEPLSIADGGTQDPGRG